MPAKSTDAAYIKRFNTVLAYIGANLEGDLSVNTLSQVANFSAFHFHRQFTAYMGLPVARYVQLMRLRQAANRLASRADYAVLEAALDAGFESPEAFSRAFRRAFGVAPSTFRQQPSWQVWNAAFEVPHFSRSVIMQLHIVDFPEVRVAALEHRGPAQLLDESVRHFIQWRMQSGQSPVASSRTFGIPFSNPDTTPPEAFRFAICGEIHQAVTPNTFGVRETLIAGGRYAVVRHVGSTDLISESIYPIYRDWLPNSGEELRDQPLFFHYLSVYPETPKDQWETDIYVPLQ
ncbi:helix-turn-helix domain-containing protein [Pseudomonas mediterranea]|uniref:AraC family transcriptional regulator n=1 Tax=Pseudomonas mediterranea TaxID=183795 RepID=UPI0006D896E4|nr:AraC family transcriptional regulator [Pseudomonas mediterranea]MBL0845738.1 AraC family transcriptional regulator [Pseudomonas mediterranea]MDU9030786.1 AraC family transcriptional regulator [Pseudomonas mediterranea]QHA82442.1 helix-turn-helix domain-containing protein [Pseudomonas mediterranea]UZE03257.1 AraC family transcriptional regulator [Pseudomonas mediterranea]CAH0226109.1 Transposon Tn10 TetD protein [Pseudomonas mediterranea]